MDKSQVRGSIINGYLRFIKLKWGKRGLEKCLVDIGIYEKLDGCFLKEGMFYPVHIKNSILEWIEEKKGEKYITEGGKKMVDHLGPLSWLLRFDDPLKILENTSKEFHELYTSGDLKVDGEPGKICIELQKEDHTEYESVNCQAWKGFLHGILDITGKEGEVKKTKCSDRENLHCQFKIEYETDDSIKKKLK